MTTLMSLTPEAVTPALLETVGWAPETSRAATTVLVDQEHQVVQSRDEDVVVMPIAQALVSYPWVQELMFSLIKPDEDETLRRAFDSDRPPLGTFTWVKDNAVVNEPVQSFCVMTTPQTRQYVHDITVIGKKAQVDCMTGSAVAPELTHGKHVSISETFIGDGAKVRSVDVDRWGEQLQVHTYARTKVGVGASVSGVSVAISALDYCVSDTVMELGQDASATTHSIVFAGEGTNRDINSTTVLAGEGAQAEVVARMVSDGGKIRNHSVLASTSPDVKGFLECDGLLLADSGVIESIPALDARVDRAQLSHEASVGMIDDAKLDYLMALGMDEDAARDLIVQGFLNLDDERVPSSVRERVEDLVAATKNAEGSM